MTAKPQPYNQEQAGQLARHFSRLTGRTWQAQDWGTYYQEDSHWHAGTWFLCDVSGPAVIELRYARGRYHVHGLAPRDGTNRHKAYTDRKNPSISCASHRKPHDIARDIRRRLYDDYLVYLYAWQAANTQEAAIEELHQAQRDVIGTAGGPLLHLLDWQTDTTQARWSINTGEISGDVKLENYSQHSSLTLNLRTADPQIIAAILTAIRNL